MNDSRKEQIAKIIESHEKMIAEFQAGGIETVIAAADMIIGSIKAGGRLYVCGNGGSAADAQHIAGELVGRFERRRIALPVIALTTDTSVITSLSNDYGYENIFAKQVEALVGENDILWAISTSGTSENVVTAAELARSKGARILAFTGKTNSRLQKLSDLCFCTNNDSTARTQEIHQLGYHIICDIVEQNFCT